MLVEKRYFRKILSCVAIGADEFGGYLKKRQCIFRTGLAEEGQMKCPSHGKRILPVVMQDCVGGSFHLQSSNSPFLWRNVSI